MGTKITIKQNDFSHGMQSDTRNKNLVGKTQVFGAEKLKHFDIYKNGKLEPQPSFERFNTVAEEVFEISVVGGKEDSTVYGLGKGLSNWYGTQWDYRIRINAVSTSTEADYVFVDLSQLGNDFWDNVNADGSDVRITTVSGNDSNNYTFLKDFNSIAKTGYALCNIYEVDDLYVYFGNVDAELISDTAIDGITFDAYSKFFNDDLYLAYTLNDTIEDFSQFVKTPVPLDVGTDRYSAGKFDESLGDSAISTSVATAPGLISIGDEASVSFLFKMDANPTVDANNVIQFSNGSMQLDILSTGILQFRISTVNDLNKIYTTVSPLSTGSWHYIVISYDSNDGTGFTAYVDGVEVASDNTITGGLDDNFDPVTISLDSGMYMQMFTHLRNNSKIPTQRVAEGLMHTSGTFWTEQAIETYSSITPTVAGVAIYEKDINGTEWIESTYNGQVIKDTTSNFIMPAFVEKDTNGSFFFITSVFETLSGSSWGGRAGFDQTLIDVESTLLSSRKFDEPLPAMAFASDKENYITNSSGGLDVYAGILKSFKYVDLLGVDQQVDYSIGYNAGVYDAFPIVTSLTKYGYSLAMTGTRQGRASIEIWDLINLDPNTVIDLGAGDSKVLANVKGSLIAVIDNYIQDEGLSRGKPTLDFRAWLGQDNVKTLQSFSFDNVATVYDNNWQYAIDNRRSDLHNASVFYGEPATDWTGMWAIGAGEKSQQTGVSIMYGTDTTARPLTHHSIGNNLIVVNEDFEIYKLNDDGDYTQISEFISMVIDAGLPGIEKSIPAIEVTLDKDLPVGQTVTVSYAVDGGAYETIGTCNAKVTEFKLANGESFNRFNEMQLKIESTGGDATIVEYSIKAEYTEEVV